MYNTEYILALTDDELDDLFKKHVKRLVRYGIYRFDSQLEKSNDKTKFKETYIPALIMGQFFQKEDFDNWVIGTFETDYVYGITIRETLEKIQEHHNIEIEIQTHENPSTNDIHIDYYRILGIKTNLIKSRTIIQNGKIVEQKEYEYNPNISYLKKALKAKTPQEQHDFYKLFLGKKEKVLIEKEPLQLKFESALFKKNPDDLFEYFRYLAKYKAQKEIAISLIRRYQDIISKLEISFPKEQLFLNHLPMNLFEPVDIIEPSDEEIEGNTIPRRVLVMHYLLEEAGIVKRNTTSITAVTNLLHMLLNIKPPKRIQDSNIYKYVSKAPNYKEDSELVKDLRYIRDYFEKLNAKKIVDSINSEIKQCQ